MLATQEVLRGPYHGFAPPINYFGLALSQIYTEAAILGETRNLDAVLHKGAEATLGALHKVRGGVLSFVTHASADVDAPERSGVQLAAREGPDILEWVTALEFLVGLDQLRCELLLLWGCQTHGSGAQSGDNWLGISRSFLRAGRTLVSSLWSIDITTTVLLSVEFMQGLVEGLTVPQAMRRAMRMVQRADLTKLKEWTQVIEKALPNEERNELISAWKNELGLTAAEYGYTITPPTKLKQLKQWAPYVTIGWPGTLSMVERK